MIEANPLVAIHPLVRVHPETGERALYVSPSFTGHDSEIIGFSKRHSQRILDLFYEQVARPQYTVRFRWQPGDVAFWDNRSTAHLGPGDLDHLDFDRVFYRVRRPSPFRRHALGCAHQRLRLRRGRRGPG